MIRCASERSPLPPLFAGRGEDPVRAGLDRRNKFRTAKLSGISRKRPQARLRR